MLFISLSGKRNTSEIVFIRGPFEKFVEWWQCDVVMQREEVTVTPSCIGGSNVVVM
jgi:hypothetical protein